MAFKQGNNPIIKKNFSNEKDLHLKKRKEASVSMEDLKKMSAKQDAESKAQGFKTTSNRKTRF